MELNYIFIDLLKFLPTYVTKTVIFFPAKKKVNVNGLNTFLFLTKKQKKCMELNYIYRLKILPMNGTNCHFFLPKKKRK